MLAPMGLVSKGEARVWTVGVTLFALVLIFASWLYYGGGDDASETGEPSPEAAPDASAPASPSFDALGPAGSLIRSTDPVPAGVLRLLLSTPGGARLCTVDGPSDGMPLSHATCEPAEVEATAARVAAVDDGAPVAFVMPDALARLDGTMWWSGTPVHGWIASADHAAVLSATDGARELVRLDATGEVGRSDAPPPVGPGSPALVWDRLLWLERTGDDADALRARDAFDEETTLVGAVPAESTRMAGCRSSEALAIVVDGKLVHGKKQVAVTFLTDDGWSEPDAREAGIYEYEMTCRGSEATLTWIEPGEESDTRQVMQIRCRPGACEKTVGRAGFAGSDPVAVDLAGRVLLVWAEGGRTHARLAPLVELDRAADLPPLPQPASPVLSRHLYVRGGTAVLVYRTRGEGLVAVRIDARGEAQPLPVRERSAL